MMNNFKNVLWGIVLVIVGVIIGTNSFGLTNINIFFDGWWTLLLKTKQRNHQFKQPKE